MSTEAMKLVIGAFDSLSPDHPARHTVLHINALRDAVQQAEAQQPATGEAGKIKECEAFIAYYDTQAAYWDGRDNYRAAAYRQNAAICRQRLEAEKLRELKTLASVQTTPNFTQLTQILDGLNHCHSRDSRVEFLRSWIRDWTQHKVDKLTHQAPSEPATDEPVLTVEREPDYWSGGHFCEGTKPHINPMKVWSLPIGTKLYTRPAPGVPEGFALVPMTEDQVWHNDSIMSANAIGGLKMDAVMRIVRGVEAHHSERLAAAQAKGADK